MKSTFLTTALTRVVRLGLIAAIVFAAASGAEAQYEAWHYSANLDVGAGSVARTDAVAELQINFTTLLAGAGGSGKTLDRNSIRVVEYTTSARTTIAGERPSQFDIDADFEAKTRAGGELVWLLPGTTAAGATRYFKLFYDVTENGTMTAPSYSAGLAYDPVGRVVETPGYRAVYSAKYGSVRRLDSKLPGSARVMWDAPETGYPLMGHWHTINEDGAGWIDSFGGASDSVDVVKSGPVRVTITSRRDEGRVTWTTTRRFYGGARPVPYWKVDVRIEKNPGSAGRGAIWLKRVVWSVTNAPSPRTLDPLIPANQFDIYETVKDYGADGGVGVAASGNYAFDRSEVIAGGEAHQAEFETWGQTWRMKHYPIQMSYAFGVHGATDAAAATAAIESVWADYNNPLIIVLTNRATLTGTVIDALSSLPVRDAVVRVKSGFTWYTTTTTATGKYELVNLPTGGVSVTAKAEHYTYLTQNVTLAAGPNTLNISLAPAQSLDLRSSTLGGTANWLLAMDVQNGGIVNPPSDDYSAASASESGFVATEVPGDWDLQQGPTDDTYGWYRTHVTVPAGWSGNPLRLRNFRVDDVDATYFNGVKIGQTGQFPDASDPRVGSDNIIAFASPRDYFIPAANVVFGADNVIAIRVYDYRAGGGIIVGEPILEVAHPGATLTGTVTGPGGAVAGATVTVAGVGTAVTNAAGQYTFTNVPGNRYDIGVTAFGFKAAASSVEVPDTGSITKNITLEASGSVSGTVTRAGVPMRNVRVVWTGPASGSVLTGANGQYNFSATEGSYNIVFNALGAVPKTENITVGAAPYNLNVALEVGVTPAYDMFPGTALDMSKWQFGNMEPESPASDPVATVSGGVLKLEMAPRRGGLWSTSYFGTVSTQELIFARPYQGVNQIMNLYAGTGSFGNFVEMANEGETSGYPRVAVFGTATNPTTINYSKTYPFAVAVVRTHNWFDFYVNGQHMLSDFASGVSGQHRLYLYGFEETGATVGYYSAVAAGTPVAPVSVGVGGSRNAALGAAVTVSQAIVTASFPEAFWIQKPNEPHGIKVLSAPATQANPDAVNPAVATLVNVSGRVVAVDAETAIQAVLVQAGGGAAVPDPYIVLGRALKWLNAPGAQAQGLYATLYGQCTGIVYDEQFNPVGMYIDDGSGLQYDAQFRGVYVILQPEWQLEGFVAPVPGQFVIATGVVTVTTRTGSPAPALRPVEWTNSIQIF